MSKMELSGRCRHAAYRGYMDAIKFVIARKDKPELANPANPYAFTRADECLAWRAEFDEIMKRKGYE